ncbi:VOC family protein [Kutzneria sp. NPDC052558]|uniref:VOC family protein n=1 Tax=Kutzneria sp. NPDC052558 TaxID=3364121 RepID=UPI0037CC09C4
MGLGVANLADAREFYEKHWQLEVVDADDDRLYLGAACPESHVLRLRATDQPRVDLISLAADTQADVDGVAERVARHPLARMVAQPATRQDLGGGYGLRFLDCDGRTVEVATEVVGRAFEPVRAADSRPKTISHVVFNTPDLTATRTFYESVLGFKVSDWVEDFFCFMRTGKAHHILAFTRSAHASLNHVAFEVHGLDEFMRATGGMMRRGFQPVWGPGRHGVGNNTFSYFQDPSSGFVMEYTTELQLIDDEHGWVPKVYPANDIDRWGTANELDDAVRSLMRGRPDPGLWAPPPV